MATYDEVGEPQVEDDDLGLEIERNIGMSMDLHDDWRTEAQTCYDAYASHQWEEQYLYDAEELERVAFVFNRSSAFVDAVAGLETNNKREVSYTPVQRGDVQKSEIMTKGADWVGDQCGAEFHHSDAFRDMLTCGVGATLTTLDYEQDPDGKIIIERLDPLRVNWDPSSTARNATDRRWVSFTKIVPLDELKDQYGDDIVDKIVPSSYWSKWLEETPSSPYRSSSEWLAGKADQARRSTVDRPTPVVEYYYWKRIKRYQIQLPDDTTDVVSEKVWKELRKQVKDDQIDEFDYTQVWGREYRRAIAIGRHVVSDGLAATDGWQLNMMTGRRDRKINSWYGILRPLLGPKGEYGPQHLINALYTEILDIIANNSKGGLLAETDAFENPSEAEDRWSSGKSIVWLNSGAIAGQKVMEKPQGAYPSNLDRMMQWAVESFPQVAGVSWEMLGLADREQPGVLEAQRKQSGVSILADFFDAMKQYKVEHGRCLAEMIKRYYAGTTEGDSRLIKIVEDDQSQWVPLLKSEFDVKFDVTVDESPISPNQRQQTWAVLQGLLPFLMKAGLPITPEVIDYLPLPERLLASWRKMMEQAQQQQQQAQQQQMEMQQRMQQIQEQMQQVQTAKTQADTSLAAAKTEGERADIEAQREELRQEWVKLEIERDKVKAQAADALMKGADPSKYRDTISPQQNQEDGDTNGS